MIDINNLNLKDKFRIEIEQDACDYFDKYMTEDSNSGYERAHSIPTHKLISAFSNTLSKESLIYMLTKAIDVNEWRTMDIMGMIRKEVNNDNTFEKILNTL